MTWNNSPLTTVEGNCAICGKEVKRRQSIHSARQIKELNCGGYRCKQQLNIRRHREKRERLKAKGVKA